MFNRLECRRVSPLLWEHAEGGLRDSEKKAVEQHLKRCPACTRALANAQQLQDSLSAYRTQEIPASRATWHALRTQIEVQNYATAVAAQRRSFRAPLWAATATAGAIAALIVVPMFPRPGQPKSIISKGGVGAEKPVKDLVASVSPKGTGEYNTAEGHGVTASAQPKKDKPPVQSPRDHSRGEIKDLLDRQPVKQHVRPPKKSEQKNAWNNYKASPSGANIETVSMKQPIKEDMTDLDGAKPSGVGRKYDYVNNGIPADRSNSLNYVMGTIGDSRARLIPASNRSEESPVW